jgi:hypothetical protein
MVAGLVLAGATVRLLLLQQPMRLDESATYVLLASKSLHECFTNYLAANNHPLHTLLVHFVATSIGREPWCLRLPSFIAGIAVLPATYALYSALVDRATGAVACALAGASSSLVEYGTNARGYSLQTLFVLVFLLLATKLVRAPTRGAWVGFCAAAVLAFYTLPTTLYCFAGAALWMLLSARKDEAREDRLRFAGRVVLASVIVAATTAALYAPFVAASGLDAVVANRWVKPLSPGALLAAVPEMFGRYARFFTRGFAAPVLAVLGACLVAGVNGFRRVARFRVDPAAVAVLAALAMMLVQRVLPPERVLLPLVPLVLGTCAVGARWCVAGAVHRWPSILEGSAARIAGALGPLVIGVALAASTLASGAAYQTVDQVTFRDAEPLTEVLAGILRDDDVVYVHPDAYIVLAYYFGIRGVPTKYLYAYPERRRAIGRAFVVDSSSEYAPFSYQSVLAHCDLARRAYTLVPVAKLGAASLFQVADPELAPAP